MGGRSLMLDQASEKEQLFSNRDLRNLILPLILEQLLEVTVGMMDTLMASAVGEAAVSGVSLVDEVMVLMINVFAALATGGAVIVGHALGKKDTETAKKAAEQAMVFITVASVGIMVLLYAGKRFVLQTVFGSIDPNVRANADIYYRIVSASIPWIALYNTGAAIFRVMGNSRISMRTSLLMNGINMTGNALFVYGLGMGTAGVALPTLISRMVAAVVITILLFQKRYPVHLQKTLSFGTDRNMIRRILWIGIPNGLENGIFQLGRILTVRIISAFGTTAIAANAVSNKIVMFQIMAGAAVGLSMITVVSQCIGAGSYAQAERYTKKLMKLTYLLCVLLVILTFVALPWINKAYHLSAPTRAIVMKLVIYHGICMVTIWPFAWALPYTLRAAGDVRFTMGVSIASMWIFRIGFGLILGEFLRMGIFGVWIAMTIDWFFRGLCFGYRYFCGTWEKHKI